MGGGCGVLRCRPICHQLFEDCSREKVYFLLWCCNAVMGKPRGRCEGFMIRLLAGRATPLSSRSMPSSSSRVRQDAPGVPGSGVTLPLVRMSSQLTALLPPPQHQVSDMTKQM